MIITMFQWASRVPSLQRMSRSSWSPSTIVVFQLRTHMNHGNPDGVAPRPSPASGPRPRGAAMGLEVAQHTSNILRLLEASHGSVHRARDALGAVWHRQAQCWRIDDNDDKWHAFSPFDNHAPHDQPKTSAPAFPSLHALHFSDHCTALVKLAAANGTMRYLSLLRLEGESSHNDGWTILREVQVGTATVTKQANRKINTQDSVLSLQQALQQYLKIEHGGGVSDFTHATRLFAPQASLLAVGSAESDEEPSAWSAPAGHVLEIPLQTYLEGVKGQTPHAVAAATHDCIVTVDTTGRAASAVVRVGNGAQTLVFEDHILLGQSPSGVWKILSKTFSPQARP